jgi:hypothetical protein
MNTVDPTGTPWSDQEIDLIVADYFDMLRMELAGEPFIKSHRNAALQELTGRSSGSIEYKHQNISAVLQELGEPWIVGYKPAVNYQRALLDGIERYLVTQGGAVADDIFVSPLEAVHSEASEVAAALFIEPAPELQVRDAPEKKPEALIRLVRKFDPAARDARNRALGWRGEERIFVSEQARLKEAGRDDLSRKVEWVSQSDDGAGFDILSFSPEGGERLLEVKTTNGYQHTPFYLTENERALSTERPDAFRLVRLFEFNRTPRVFELTPPLEESVMLRPINYRASFSD